MFVPTCVENEKNENLFDISTFLYYNCVLSFTMIGLSSIWRVIYDRYWVIYKSCVPDGCRCLDDGPDFVHRLSLMGKLLYLVRPFMIRRKKRQTQTEPILRKPKIPRPTPAELVYDPTGTRPYYVLIANSLQTVSLGDECHISSDHGESSQFMNDGTQIVASELDVQIYNEWLHMRRVAYLLTQETCCFSSPNKLCINQMIQEGLMLHNAGGSSVISEVISMYYMNIRFGATYFIPEMSVKYDLESKICDYIMTIDQIKVGVSVTRAVLYPFSRKINSIFATSLLRKKMFSLILAKRAVTDEHRFQRMIVHIWCQLQEDFEVLKNAYQTIVQQDIYRLYEGIGVICTLCSANFIYTNENIPELVII